MTRPVGMLRAWRAFVLPGVLLALCEIYGRRAAALGSDALAPPTAALRALADAARDGTLWQATGFTLGTAALGLAVGAALALVLGFVLGLSRRAAHLGGLTVEVLRPVPSVALIPLSVLAFGFGLRMELAVVAFATFWPMLILVQVAVQQVEPRLLEVSRVLGLTTCQRAFKILLPAIVPRLFVALRAGVGIALVVAVTVEVAANPHGMGYAMMIAQQSFDPALMLAWLGWIGVVGFAINAAMVWLQRRVAIRMGAAA
ncbi:ABC transporter permease [Variovorax sp. OV329]|uniref:ABC transporter permease n=1 Tax=Variovorax sp. OV329 TaxID=1882825 RepID=UPI0008E47F58|nr:ABC transporter permease subunit [Variovorax sp. OV329]SFM94028.1 ABC-type nitrate/sulfonate/bicarbonate transport system, permease component [Variovorax sp. OV329]